MSRIILVDEFDNEIGLKERSEIGPSDMYRVSGLWLTNSKGEVLLAKRSLLKAKNPGKWSCASAGHVDEGEDYEINILKETEEELGLTLTASELRTGPKLKFTGTNTYWITWFFAEKDISIEDLVIQEEEVSEVRWFSISEIQDMLRDTPEVFTSGFREWARHLDDSLARVAS